MERSQAPFFFLLGMVAFARNRFFASGLLLGLALLAKHMFVLSLLSTGVLFLGRLFTVPAKRTVLRASGFLAAGLAVPLSTWEAIRFFSLGWEAYLENWTAYLQIMRAYSDDLAVSGSSLLDHLQTLGNPFGGSLFWIALVFWLAILGTCLFSFRDGFREGTRNLENETLGLQLALFASLTLLWWFLRTESAWWRYLLPGNLALSILAGVAIAGWMRSIFQNRLPALRVCRSYEHANGLRAAPPVRGSRSLYPALTALVFAFTFLRPLQFQATRLPREIRQTHHYQHRLAEQIRGLSDQGVYFGYWGWFQAPELSFLS